MFTIECFHHIFPQSISCNSVIPLHAEIQPKLYHVTIGAKFGYVASGNIQDSHRSQEQDFLTLLAIPQVFFQDMQPNLLGTCRTFMEFSGFCKILMISRWMHCTKDLKDFHGPLTTFSEKNTEFCTARICSTCASSWWYVRASGSLYLVGNLQWLRAHLITQGQEQLHRKFAQNIFTQ